MNSLSRFACRQALALHLLLVVCACQGKPSRNEGPAMQAGDIASMDEEMSSSDRMDQEMSDDRDEPTSSCVQGTDAFVREATLVLVGRRPLSDFETQAAVAFIDQIGALDEPETGRQVWATALMATEEFKNHWEDVLLDALQAPRADIQSLAQCYGKRVDGGNTEEIARHVRDHSPLQTLSTPFTFLDLLRSSLALDDLSPVYRAHLFAMLLNPSVCANVDPIGQELFRRQNVGDVFDAVYLNRDQVCLSCHNSEFSVTYSSEPEENRHFPIAAKLEQAVFGASSGVPEATVQAVFRAVDFVVEPFAEALLCEDQQFAYCSEELEAICDDGSEPRCPGGEAPTCEGLFGPSCPEEETATTTDIHPWGADPGCGTFAPEVPDDPADIEARLASVMGKRATVLDLERALARGIDELSGDGLVVDMQGEVESPDAALAYLLAMSVVDRVWKEIIGSPLTIATHFPRTQDSRDLLQHLTDHFAAKHFSLKTLLLDIMSTDYFNAVAPEQGCREAYYLPAVFDPWVRDEVDEQRRRNSGADGAHPLTARTLLSSTYAAMDWPVLDHPRFSEALLLGEDFGDFEGFEGFEEDASVPQGDGGGEEVVAACAEVADCGDLAVRCIRSDECCEAFYGSCGIFGRTSEDPERNRRETAAACAEVRDCDALALSCFRSDECCEAFYASCGVFQASEDPEFVFLQSIGAFLNYSLNGFRGLDVGARLAWEERFGGCQKPDMAGDDVVDKILSHAGESVSLLDGVLALKDRLIGEARIDEGETALLEQLIGANLEERLSSSHEPGLRRLCGALLASPEHMLAGLPPRGGEPPELLSSRQQAYETLAGLPVEGYHVSCDNGALRVEPSAEGK